MEQFHGGTNANYFFGIVPWFNFNLDLMMVLIRVVILMSCLLGSSQGQLRCYTCGFSSEDTDRSCLTISNSTRFADCNYKYCTIFRQEYVNPPGAFASFFRSCHDSPDFLNHVVTDSTFKTYYRACTSDLCNIGDGIQSVGGGNLSPNEYNGPNLLVPGTKTGGASASINTSSVLIFTMSLSGVWYGMMMVL